MGQKKKAAPGTFGWMLLRRREELDLTQSQVAERIGVQPNYIVYLEQGERKPSNKTVRKVAEALDLDKSDLFLAANPDVREFVTIVNRSIRRSEVSGLRQLNRLKALLRHMEITTGDLKWLEHVPLPRGRSYTPRQICMFVVNTKAMLGEDDLGPCIEEYLRDAR